VPEPTFTGVRLGIQGRGRAQIECCLVGVGVGVLRGLSAISGCRSYLQSLRCSWDFESVISFLFIYLRVVSFSFYW
jgi:hypothetical protein